jgi:coenzyme Q-binding protein COQ10
MPRVTVFRTASILRYHQKPRSFISLSNPEPITFNEARILPYKSTSLYRLIADIDSYSSFLPYCRDSKVTKWSLPDQNGQRWPAEADLMVGWGGVEETFTSRLFCIPDSIVEAIGGNAETLLPRANLPYHPSSFGRLSTSNGLFKTLSTRWTIKPLRYTPQLGPLLANKAVHTMEDQSEVHLMIKFQFLNPLYAALSKAATPRIANIMIEAFQRRAKELLDNQGSSLN